MNDWREKLRRELDGWDSWEAGLRSCLLAFDGATAAVAAVAEAAVGRCNASEVAGVAPGHLLIRGASWDLVGMAGGVPVGRLELRLVASGRRWNLGYTESDGPGSPFPPGDLEAVLDRLAPPDDVP